NRQAETDQDPAEETAAGPVFLFRGTVNAQAFDVRVHCVLIITYWHISLNLSQRGQNLLAGRAARGKESADGAHDERENNPGEHRRRADAKVEGDFAESGEVADARRHAVDRQRQQASEYAAD